MQDVFCIYYIHVNIQHAVRYCLAKLGECMEIGSRVVTFHCGVFAAHVHYMHAFHQSSILTKTISGFFIIMALDNFEINEIIMGHPHFSCK